MGGRCVFRYETRQRRGQTPPAKRGGYMMPLIVAGQEQAVQPPPQPYQAEPIKLEITVKQP